MVLYVYGVVFFRPAGRKKTTPIVKIHYRCLGAISRPPSPNPQPPTPARSALRHVHRQPMHAHLAAALLYAVGELRDGRHLFFGCAAARPALEQGSILVAELDREVEL